MGADRYAAPRGAAGEVLPRPHKMGGSSRQGTCGPRFGGTSGPNGRQAVPDPPARRGGNPTQMAAAVPLPITVQAVGIERPRLQPRAESASPLKQAGRGAGSRVDRLGAGAVGISRLQPAWGVSPAVNGRAIEDTAARLICAACRARRVGHTESPRHAARAGEAAPRPYMGWVADQRWTLDLPRWGRIPGPVGVRRCLTRRPAGPAQAARADTHAAVRNGCENGCHPGRRAGDPAGDTARRPYEVGRFSW
jgi:hypothetical protein